MIGHALAFARHGHAVLPLTWPINVNGRMVCSCRKAADCGKTAAKHPLGRLVPRGLLDASTDEAVIRQWWADTPQANLGVCTDKLVVLDIDPRHNGDSSLATLERDHDFPRTWRTQTGGGGEHIVFRCPEGVEIGSSTGVTNPVLGPGIDVRARSGYIVAPPSRHLSGRGYDWSVDAHPSEIPIAEAPPWLVEALLARKHSNSIVHRDPSRFALEMSALITEYRDMAIASVAGKLLRAISIDPAFSFDLVLAWNSCHCSPPLPDQAVAEIFHRVYERELARVRSGNHA